MSILDFLTQSLQLLADGRVWFVSLGLFPLYYFVADKFFPAFLKFRFDRRLELFRRELLGRDKASSISELFVLLLHTPPTQESVAKTNKLLFDLCLSLPPCLIHKLAHTLKQTGEKDDVSLFGLFVEIRSFIDGTYQPDDKRKLDKTNIPQVSLPNTALPATPAKEPTAPQAAEIPLLSTPQTEMARLKQTL